MRPGVWWAQTVNKRPPGEPKAPARPLESGKRRGRPPGRLNKATLMKMAAAANPTAAIADKTPPGAPSAAPAAAAGQTFGSDTVARPQVRALYTLPCSSTVLPDYRHCYQDISFIGLLQYQLGECRLRLTSANYRDDQKQDDKAFWCAVQAVAGTVPAASPAHVSAHSTGSGLADLVPKTALTSTPPAVDLPLPTA